MTATIPIRADILDGIGFKPLSLLGVPSDVAAAQNLEMEDFVVDFAQAVAAHFDRADDLEKLLSFDHSLLEKGHSYGCVMVNVDPDSELGIAIAQLRGSIDTADLAGQGLEPQAHITVRYGIMPGEDVTDLRHYLETLHPFTITFGSVSMFPATSYSDGAAVIKVDVISPTLEEINAALPQHAAFKPANFDYHAHLTLAYVKEAAADKYVGDDRLAGHELEVTAITFGVPPDDLEETVSLAGAPADWHEAGMNEPVPADPYDSSDGWIGVDFDKTLAVYDGDPSTLGAPCPPDASGVSMLDRVRRWLAEGRQVRIFTARVSGDDADAQRALIETWCLHYIGQAIPVTNIKDSGMVEFWDDRAVRVGANTSERLSPSELEKLYALGARYSAVVLTADPSHKPVIGMRKASRRKKVIMHNPRTRGPQFDAIESELENQVADILRQVGALAAEQIAQLAAAGATPEDIVAAADWIGALDRLIPYVESSLTAAGRESAKVSLTDLEVDDDKLFDLLNVDAMEYARDRAAAMVGKKWEEGELVDNPDARFAISETTREDMRDLIARSYEDGLTPAEIKERLVDDFAFSESRAKLIAQTETNRAASNGAMNAWRRSGVVRGKSWQMSADHPEGIDCECPDNEDAGVVDLEEEFPSGDDAPPAHPGCLCAVVASIEGPEGDEEDSGAATDEE